MYNLPQFKSPKNFRKNKSSFLQLVKFPILLSFSIFILVSCRSVSPSPTSPATTSQVTETNQPEQQEIASAESETVQPPLVTTQPTFTLEPLITATPTALPTPSYTLMGMELTGGNFVAKVPLAADAGAGWIRYNSIRWDQLEPQEGKLDWNQAAGLETRAQAVSEAGMYLIAIVNQTPAWAQALPGYACGAIAPEKLEAFGEFMYALVSRYSQPPYNIQYWELGNEPDIAPEDVKPNSAFGCWGDKSEPYYGGEYYAEMLKVVYPQIKAADPEAKVLVGGLLMGCDPQNPPLTQSGDPQDCSPTRFLEGVLRVGGGAYFDGVSFHAYDYYQASGTKFGNAWQDGANLGFPVVYYKVRYLRALLESYDYPNKFLINTETALLCGRDQGEPYCQTDLFQQTKANYVVQSYVVAKGDGIRANIWYHYQKGWRASGLVGGNLQAYPALQAYRFVAQTLAQAIPVSQIQDFPNVVGYKFLQDTTAGQKEIWIMWSADGMAASITLPDVPNEMYDSLGQPLAPNQNFEITTDPIYLMWDK